MVRYGMDRFLNYLDEGGGRETINRCQFVAITLLSFTATTSD